TARRGGRRCALFRAPTRRGRRLGSRSRPTDTSVSRSASSKRSRRGSSPRNRSPRVASGSQRLCYSAAPPFENSEQEACMKALLARIVALVAVAVLTGPSVAVAKTEIQWWHAMTAVLGERVAEIAAKFNTLQNDYQVKAIYKGSYPPALNSPPP